MTTCQGMDEDIAAIEAWAQIFTQPEKLAKTVGKRWLFHGKEIKADIAKEEADWSAGNYFDAGKDTADALTAAVGPVYPTGPSANMSLDKYFSFMGGFLEGVVEDNHLTEITGCATGVPEVVTEVENLINDLENGKRIKAANVARKLVKDLPATFSSCTHMGEDFKTLEAWAEVFTEPKTLTADLTKAMVLHHDEITTDISDVKTEWNAAEYYKSGQAAAKLVVDIVGEAQPVPAPTNELVGFDLLEIPEIAAGFLYGFGLDNNLPEFQACYAGSADLYKYLGAALTDIEQLHLIKAMKQFELFVYHFQLDMAPCTHMQEDEAAIA